MSKRTTRALMVVLSAAAFQFALFSQTVLSAYLEDLTRYFGPPQRSSQMPFQALIRLTPLKFRRLIVAKFEMS